MMFWEIILSIENREKAPRPNGLGINSAESLTL